jgi:hypothetical protein
MSLLDWKTNETVTVYPQEEYVDSDGNINLRASAIGITVPAEVQPARQSGTSARRSEQDNEGYETEETYRVRFPRSVDAQLGRLGPQSQLDWEGHRWYFVGFPTKYNGSVRTRHRDYQIRRS